MEQRKLKLLKNLLDVILFLILFISFLVLYFINETDNYLKASTTFASRTQEVNMFSRPLLVFCFEPCYKPSIYGNVSTDLTYIFEKNDLTKEEGLADFLKHASYKLNEDIQIELQIWDDEKIVEYNLEEGKNLMDNFQFDVYRIQTVKYGLCYVIESGEMVRPEGHLRVIVTDLNSNNVNKLSNLNLFIASPETWYGIIALSWPYFELEKLSFSFDIQNTYHWMDMSVTNMSYLNGHKSVEECIKKWMATNDVCKKCSPFFFSFKNTMTSCQSYKDNHCWFYWSLYDAKNYQKYKKCMKPETTTLYKAKSFPIEKFSIQDNSVELLFLYSSDEIKIEEETLMMGTSSYIGSVGGSLGLFLGFSFFSSLSYFVGKLLSIFMQ